MFVNINNSNLNFNCIAKLKILASHKQNFGKRKDDNTVVEVFTLWETACVTVKLAQGLTTSRQRYKRFLQF